MEKINYLKFDDDIRQDVEQLVYISEGSRIPTTEQIMQELDPSGIYNQDLLRSRIKYWLPKVKEYLDDEK